MWINWAVDRRTENTAQDFKGLSAGETCALRNDERPNGRRAKPAKSNRGAKPPITRKSRKSESCGIHDLEKRLAEALRREAEAHKQQAAAAEILRVISS